MLRENPKEKIFVVARHPTAKGFDDLLSLAADKQSVPETVDRRSNVSLRRAIWDSWKDLKLENVELSLASNDGKSIWAQLQKELPYFALFRADRPNTDQESEVQVPMKLAISQALEEVQGDLDMIKAKVKTKALAVANNTLEKLQRIVETLASELNPSFRAEPKWDGIFKLTLEGDDGIPINKRGSGVRRLVLLSS